MPVNKSLLESLTKKYGRIKAIHIYSKMESESKPAFEKGLKTATKEKHTLQHLPKR